MMKSLFNVAERDEILDRLSKLKADNPRQWGKMNVAQMLTHCSLAIEGATGDRPSKQRFIGRILAPLVRKSVLGEKPFGKGAPTDPVLVITDERNFEVERTRLVSLIQRFAAAGPQEAGKYIHSFFGKLTGDEWGTLMHKHLDHHLRQFAG
jgi:Protein of unknown function (DUF1569)